MLKTTNHLLHIATFGMVCIFGDYGVEEILTVAVCIMGSWAVSHIGLSLAAGRRSAEIGALSIGIVMLYWIAYVTKLGLGMLLSDQYWVVPKLISNEALVRGMPGAFVIATIGYLALMTAVLTFPLRTGFGWEIPEFRPRIRLLSVLLPLVLVGKYILKVQFNLGIPGVDPLYLGIPYLAGLLAFVIDSGFVFVSNILLFCGLALGRPKLMLYGLLLGFTNAGIDLRFGSKDTAMYQLAIVAAYLAIARYSAGTKAANFRKTAMIAVTALAVFGIAVIGAYKFFNSFRFAMLMEGHAGLSAAIDTALFNKSADSSNSVMEIYNRITGLETLAAIMHLREALAAGGSVAGMFDGSIMQNLIYYVFGTTDVKTAFSITEFGNFYLSGGLLGLVLGSLVLGYCFCLLQYQVLRMRIHRAMTLAFLPPLWILFVFRLLGGGEMILWLKEVGVVVATFYFTARIVCPGCLSRLPGRYSPAPTVLASKPKNAVSCHTPAFARTEPHS
ncbi:MAG: hypothetical protein AB1648_02255 [Pseudomonadota bacterium]